ncbi:hypothetical protein L7F22_014293 [Adiantum nelumboides]|nr:hypothetical protein [Adiantum nelumboides]
MFARLRACKDNTKYYDILGVTKTYSTKELKKAYRKAAIMNDPNKGGDPKKFKELAQAYEVVSNPEKGDIYDQYDEDALKEGTGIEARSNFGMLSPLCSIPVSLLKYAAAPRDYDAPALAAIDAPFGDALGPL